MIGVRVMVQGRARSAQGCEVLVPGYGDARPSRTGSGTEEKKKLSLFSGAPATWLLTPYVLFRGCLASDLPEALGAPLASVAWPHRDAVTQ